MALLVETTLLCFIGPASCSLSSNSNHIVTSAEVPLPVLHRVKRAELSALWAGVQVRRVWRPLGWAIAHLLVLYLSILLGVKWMDKSNRAMLQAQRDRIVQLNKSLEGRGGLLVGVHDDPESPSSKPWWTLPSLDNWRWWRLIRTNIALVTREHRNWILFEFVFITTLVTVWVARKKARKREREREAKNRRL